MIPGSNILKTALSVISAQAVSYSQYTGRATNDIGVDVPSFATAVTIYGSVQAISRSKYEHMGLDLQKNYVMLFTSTNITDLERNKAGDRFTYGGRLFQCVSSTDWAVIDGWQQVLSVDITEDTDA